MASICNAERASSGVMSGHDRKILSLSGQGLERSGDLRQGDHSLGVAADRAVGEGCAGQVGHEPRQPVGLGCSIAKRWQDEDRLCHLRRTCREYVRSRRHNMDRSAAVAAESSRVRQDGSTVGRIPRVLRWSSCRGSNPHRGATMRSRFPRMQPAGSSGGRRPEALRGTAEPERQAGAAASAAGVAALRSGGYGSNPSRYVAISAADARDAPAATAPAINASSRMPSR